MLHDEPEVRIAIASACLNTSDMRAAVCSAYQSAMPLMCGLKAHSALTYLAVLGHKGVQACFPPLNEGYTLAAGG